MTGRGIVAAACNVVGTGLLLLVILSSLSTMIARQLGYEPYAIVSGSMEPAIPTGSMAYVTECAPESVADGDVIAFLDMRGDVVVHRVVRNRLVEGEFVTKGDANAEKDMNPIPYNCLIGRVQLSLPFAGYASSLYASQAGKVYAVCIALCGAMLNVVASKVRGSKKEIEQILEDLHDTQKA